MAFRIDRDVLTPAANAVLSAERQLTSSEGLIFPRDRDTSELQTDFAEGAVQRFRLLDDDDELYYEGSFIEGRVEQNGRFYREVDTGDGGRAFILCDELDIEGDLGPYAWSHGEGVTQIQYLQEDGSWKGLV